MTQPGNGETLAPDAADIAGTGMTAFDDEGRLWVQIEFESQDDRPGDFGGERRFGTTWVAGWFLTDEDGVFTDR